MNVKDIAESIKIYNVRTKYVRTFTVAGNLIVAYTHWLACMTDSIVVKRGR